jgi:hypothetical protein
MCSTSLKDKFYFGNVFYTILGIQRHIIYYFWTQRSKDINFTRLNILRLNFNDVRKVIQKVTRMEKLSTQKL